MASIPVLTESPRQRRPVGRFGPGSQSQLNPAPSGPIQPGNQTHPQRWSVHPTAQNNQKQPQHARDAVTPLEYRPNELFASQIHDVGGGGHVNYTQSQDRLDSTDNDSEEDLESPNRGNSRCLLWSLLVDSISGEERDPLLRKRRLRFSVLTF